jgi:hypothetical protein
MMRDHPPEPPAELDPTTASTLADLSPEALREVERYVDALAEYKQRQDQREQESESEPEDRPDDLPEEVPSGATLTIKEINDNRYYYWQWRDGEKIRSKYKAPVNPSQ